MSKQVGALCYSSPADIGAAACSQFEPVRMVDASYVRSVTCESADIVTGALNLKVQITSVFSGTTWNYSITQLPTFPDCVLGEYVDVVGLVFGGVLLIAVTVYTGKAMLSYIGWSRGQTD